MTRSDTEHAPASAGAVSMLSADDFNPCRTTRNVSKPRAALITICKVSGETFEILLVLNLTKQVNSAFRQGKRVSLGVCLLCVPFVFVLQ